MVSNCASSNSYKLTSDSQLVDTTTGLCMDYIKTNNGIYDVIESKCASSQTQKWTYNNNNNIFTNTFNNLIMQPQMDNSIGRTVLLVSPPSPVQKIDFSPS